MSLKKPDRGSVTDRSSLSACWPATAEPVFTAVSGVLAEHLTAPEHSSPQSTTCGSASLLVAYSGGVDSHVLLVTAKRWCAQRSNVALRAVYIDHGLQIQSGAWAQHCREVCDSLNIAFRAVTVHIQQNDGSSLEQAARDARYQALAAELQENEFVLTAHHVDDQAETVLLQLLRGAGVRGLAAMPVIRNFGSGFHLRPLLSVSRDQLQQAAQALQLQWVEDHSNEDTRFNRNYIRSEVMPLLRKRWPSVASSLSRTAVHSADAAGLLQELAHQDLSLAAAQLSIDELRALSASRRRNVLRAWIEQQGSLPPSTAVLRHIEHDLIMAADDSSGQVQFDQTQIRRHRNTLYLGAEGSFDEVAAFCYQWADRSKPLCIAETGQTLVADDIDLPWLKPQATLVVKSRQGGEKIRLANSAHIRSVKTLLQQQGLPPWRRCRLPLVWYNDHLVGIVGIGFSASPNL